MARKKVKDKTRLLSHPIRTRVTEGVYKKLNAFVGNGDCHSIGEAARRVLSREKILCVYKDNTVDVVMEELLKVRQELNAIGVNINQITHHFHLAETIQQKTFHVLKVAEQYRKVGDKVDKLMELISQVAKKWLQG